MTPAQLLDSIPVQAYKTLLLKIATADVVAAVTTDAELFDSMLEEGAAFIDERDNLMPPYLLAHGRRNGVWLVTVQATEQQRQSKKTHRLIAKLVLAGIVLLGLTMALKACGVGS